ncbi:MAG: hypothetical protein AAF658_00035, partial [Myxococcota bacterium]
LAVIIDRCLKRDPSERFATAEDLATDLRRWLSETGTGAPRLMDQLEPILSGQANRSISRAPTVFSDGGELATLQSKPTHQPRSRAYAIPALAALFIGLCIATVVALVMPDGAREEGAKTGVERIPGAPSAIPKPEAETDEKRDEAADASATETERLRPTPKRKRRPRRVRVDTRAGRASPATADQAQLSVRTTPPLDVYLGKQKLGRSPLSARLVPADQLTLRLVDAARGFSTSVQVDTRSGKGAIDLRLAKGKLAVLAEPWATVYAGETELGTTPFAPVELLEGTYTLRFSNPEQGLQAKRRIVVRAGQLSKLKVQLK